jgi:hypothetical protein
MTDDATPEAPNVLAVAERVAELMAPTVRKAIARATVGYSAMRSQVDQFVDEFHVLDELHRRLPPTAGPMARLELESRMIDLAAAFVRQQRQARLAPQPARGVRQ